MPEYALLQRVTLSSTLWLIVALPLTGLLGAAVHRRFGHAPPQRPRSVVGAIAAAPLSITLIVVFVEALRLARLAPADRFFVQPLWRLVRAGDLDATVGFAFDPLAALICAIVLVGGIVAVAASPIRATDAQPRIVDTRTLAWIDALVAATLFMALADNVITMLFGAQIAAICAQKLVRRSSDGATTGSIGFYRAADAALILGAIALFWSIGSAARIAGEAGGFTRAYEAISVADRSGADGGTDDANDIFLTFVSPAGATVFVDEARTPLSVGGKELRAPFVRQPIRGGAHSFRIHVGDGFDDATVRGAPIRASRELSIVPVGPTLVFREMRDGVNAELRLWGDPSTIRARPLLGFALVLLIVGVAVRAAPLLAQACGPIPPDAPDAPDALPAKVALRCAAGIPTATYLALRLQDVVALSPAAGSAIAAAGGFTAFTASILAARASRLRPLLGYVAIAQVGTALTGAGLGAFVFSAQYVLIAAAIDACLLLATAPRNRDDLRPRAHDARAYFIACAAASGAPMPFFGVFSPQAGIALASLGPPAGSVAFKFVLFAFALGAAFATSFALWRSNALLFGGARERRNSRRGGVRPLALFAALVGAVGVALAMSRAAFGEAGESLLATWLEPTFQRARWSVGDAVAGRDWGAQCGLVALWGAASLAGFALARARSRDATLRTHQRASFIGPDPSAGRIGTSGIAMVVASATRLRGLVASFDRWVIDGAVHFCIAAIRAAAWVAARADEELLVAPVDAAALRLTGALGRRGATRPWSRRSIGRLALFALVASALAYTLWRRP